VETNGTEQRLQTNYVYSQLAQCTDSSIPK
jgi:hypothetical protein